MGLFKQIRRGRKLKKAEKEVLNQFSTAFSEAVKDPKLELKKLEIVDVSEDEKKFILILGGD